MTSNARQFMRSSPLQQGVHKILFDFNLCLASACGAGTEVSSVAAQFQIRCPLMTPKVSKFSLSIGKIWTLSLLQYTNIEKEDIC
jgi:hypothetical protein